MSRFMDAVRAEWLKVFTTRSWWVLGLVMVLYIGFTAALMALLTSSLFGPSGDMPLEGAGLTTMVYSLGTAMGYVFPVLIGALSVTAENRHNTITPTFISVGQRGPVLTAKVAVQGTLGLLYGVAALLSAVLASVFFFMGQGMSTGLAEGGTWMMFLRSVIAMGLWAVVGVGLGALIRSQAGAIVVVLVFTQFIEPLARMAGGFNDTISQVTKFLPGPAPDAFVGSSIYSEITVGGAGQTLLWWQGGLVMAGYGVVVVVAAWLTRWRADVS